MDDLKDLLSLGAERHLRRRGRLSRRRNHFSELRPELFQREPERVEDPLHLRVRLREDGQARETKKEMLGTDVRVAHADRFVLSEREDALRAVGESTERSLYLRAGG